MLRKLVDITREQANGEQGNQAECKLEGARQWVKSLAEILDSDPAGGSQASESLHRAEEASEREWAAQNSFQNYTRNLPCQFTLSQYLECAAGFQAGLQARRFSGNWAQLGKPHTTADLLDLADRAEAALDAFDLDSFVRGSAEIGGDDGGGGGDSDGGGCASGGGPGSKRGSGDPGGSGEGGGSTGRAVDDSDANTDGGTAPLKRSRRGGAGGFGEHSSSGEAGGESGELEGGSGGGAATESVGAQGNSSGRVGNSCHSGSSSVQGGGGSRLCDWGGRGLRGGSDTVRSRCSAAASASEGGIDSLPNQAELSEEGTETASAGDSVWYADEDPEAMPADARQEELGRRIAARQALAAFKRAQAEYAAQQEAGGGGGAAAAEPVRPLVEQPRIWKDGEWLKRVAVPRQEIKGWGTAYLTGEAAQRAAGRPPSTRITGSTDRGDKYVEEGSLYIRRSDGEGLCVFSGERGLPAGTIAGQYVGSFFDADAQSRHKTGSQQGRHWLTLRTSRASMPLTVTGIDGAVQSTLVDGRRHDLDYYLNNGVASLANSRRHAECNCKLLVEYPNYESIGQLFIDDEYCPDHVPMNQRVTLPTHTPLGCSCARLRFSVGGPSHAAGSRADLVGVRPAGPCAPRD